MLVAKAGAKDIIDYLSEQTYLACDTETTGLHPYNGDKIFSVIFADPEQQFYFDFNPLSDHADVFDDLSIFQPVFSSRKTTLFMHNAKFDWHFFNAGGLQLRNNVFCTMAMYRLVNNGLRSYSLDALAPTLGYRKDDKVREYIKRHDVYDKMPDGSKKPRYDKVPLDLMLHYAEMDTKITFELGKDILRKLAKQDSNNLSPHNTLSHVMATEIALTRVLQEMEATGIKIDFDYVQAAFEHEKQRYEWAKRDYKRISGNDFLDSNEVHRKTFDALDLSYPITDKGNPSFRDNVLDQVNHEIGNVIQTYREAYKKAHTYYENYMELCDDNDIIHCSFFQSGTATGRMSSRDPNLQNVNKETIGEHDYYVRKCFVPREGFTLFMLDYDQMEYRLMLDYAKEMPIIEQVKAGVDIHTATAELMNVPRVQAKTINFMLLYGGGAQKLADNLGVSLTEAKQLKALYFEKLPNVNSFLRRVIQKAQARGFIFNWSGRRCHLDRGFEYKAPNYLIQGGCADVVKSAMVSIWKLLESRQSRMLLQVHDELVLEIHDSEYDLIPEIKEIMEKAYPHKHLPLTCGVEYSKKSWAEKENYVF